MMILGQRKQNKGNVGLVKAEAIPPSEVEAVVKSHAAELSDDALKEVARQNEYLTAKLSVKAEVLVSSRIPIGVELTISPGQPGLTKYGKVQYDRVKATDRFLLLLTGASFAGVLTEGCIARYEARRDQFSAMRDHHGRLIPVSGPKLSHVPAGTMIHGLWHNYVVDGEPAVFCWAGMRILLPVGRGAEVTDAVMSALRSAQSVSAAGT